MIVEFDLYTIDPLIPEDVKKETRTGTPPGRKKDGEDSGTMTSATEKALNELYNKNRDKANKVYYHSKKRQYYNEMKKVLNQSEKRDKTIRKIVDKNGVERFYSEKLKKWVKRDYANENAKMHVKTITRKAGKFLEVKKGDHVERIKLDDMEAYKPNIKIEVVKQFEEEKEDIPPELLEAGYKPRKNKEKTTEIIIGQEAIKDNKKMGLIKGIMPRISDQFVETFAKAKNVVGKIITTFTRKKTSTSFEDMAVKLKKSKKQGELF